MQEECREKLAACPSLVAAFRILGKRWNAVILDVLAQRPARFRELARAVDGISDRMLGERLRELADANLITHQCPCDAPATYDLTPTARHLLPALDQIRTWGKELPLDEHGNLVGEPPSVAAPG